MQRFLLTILLISHFGCAEKEFDPNDPKKSFAIAKEPYDDEFYEQAINRLGEFKARFPYSQYSIEAELLIANAYFELSQYPEAAATYSLFAKLHPKHPKVDFAIFREGESYWQDSPEDVDREQHYTQKAIDVWKKLEGRFPQSQYTAEVKRKIATGKRRIAEAIAFSARFYCKQEVYHACAYRFQELLERFPHYKDLRQEALEKAALSFDMMAKQKQKDAKSDKNLYFRSMTPQQMRDKASELRKLTKGS